MNGKELVKLMKNEGWILDRISGSHYIMIKEGMRSIPVPVHGNKDLPMWLVNKIIKESNIKK
jgi:predicted RNA binding protein YcfA (HicA-like mRNA interferase family)